MRTPSPRLALAAATLALLVPALAACGSTQDDKSTLPSVSGSPKKDQPSDDTSPPVAKSREEANEAFVKFQDCLVANGLSANGATNGASREQSEAAFAACEPILKDAGVGQNSGPPPAEMQNQMLALAKCMRDEGFDFPDPTFDNSGRVQLPAPEGSEGAMQKCSQKAGMQMGTP